MHKLDALFRSTNTKADYVKGYFERMSELMAQADLDKIGEIIEILENAAEENRTVFLVANGGSSAVASHFVNDLAPSALAEGYAPFRLYSLTDNVAALTAVANDCGYENIFSRQLESLMRPGDVIIALSVSGNSENIVRGVEYAKAHEGRTVGITGFDGGRLAAMVDVSLLFESTGDEYGPVEDMFSLVSHIVSGYLTMKRGKKLSH